MIGQDPDLGGASRRPAQPHQRHPPRGDPKEARCLINLRGNYLDTYRRARSHHASYLPARHAAIDE